MLSRYRDRHGPHACGAIMSNWWYLTRSSGIVATVLAVAALAWGLMFSARATGERLRPAWWLDLHNWLGGLTLAFTGVHVLASFADHDSGIGLKQVFIPGTATDQTTAITFGVLATYVFIVVVFTSWPKLRARRSVWRAIHLLSLPATVLAGVHAYKTGSDQQATPFQILLILLVGFATYPIFLRLLGLITKPRH